MAGFSLLEMMIAIAVLGIGLVMVAAIFPVAIYQHRRSADETLALQHAYQAKAIVRAKIEPTLGSGPIAPATSLLPHSLSPVFGQFFIVPFQSLPLGFPLGEDPYAPINPQLTGVLPTNDVNYATFLNNGGVNPIVALRVWSDTCGPPKQFADVPGAPREDLKERPRYVWYAFYRYDNPADVSAVSWFVAVCRVTGGQYIAQPGATLPSSQTPLPWRIGLYTSAASPPNPRVLSSPTPLLVALPANQPTTLLVPRGAKLFSQATGSLYTVVRTLAADEITPNSINPFALELREPVNATERSPGAYWVFPPPAGGSESPYVAGLVF